jgi:hypothetical protein
MIERRNEYVTEFYPEDAKRYSPTKRRRGVNH